MTKIKCQSDKNIYKKKLCTLKFHSTKETAYLRKVYKHFFYVKI